MMLLILFIVSTIITGFLYAGAGLNGLLCVVFWLAFPLLTVYFYEGKA